MRTTVRIDDQLLRRAKQLAASRGRTLAGVVEDGLRMLLAEDRPVSAKPIRLPTYRGGGLRKDVDLDDSAALLDIMEPRR